MSGDAWISAHIFHAGSLDRMALELVAPLRDDLADGIDGLFFLRYWEGGPHLRLRIRPRGADEGVRRLVADRASAYLDRRPSRRSLTEREYRRLADTAAAGERLLSHERRLHPNDSVRFFGYRPEHHAFGGPACMPIVEQHFTESSAIALDLLARQPCTAQRAAIGVAVLYTVLAVCEPELDRAARAAAALRFPASPPVEEAFRRARSGLTAQARACWEGPPPRDGPLADWAESVSALHGRLTELNNDPSDAGSPLSFLARGAVPRILLRCTHLLNNRLGVAPGIESRLALLAARTLAELHQEHTHARLLA